MIRYAARCEGGGHEFDGWYKDSAAFDRLARAGLIECPSCGDTRVSKALMAPAVVSSRRRAAAEPVAPPPQPQPTAAQTSPVPAPPPPPTDSRAAAGPMPAQLVAMLQRMRAEVEKSCDYVGPRFASEARKMHEGEIEHRGIYGEATPEEAEALREDGIAVSRIPWVPKADG